MMKASKGADLKDDFLTSLFNDSKSKSQPSKVITTIAKNKTSTALLPKKKLNKKQMKIMQSQSQDRTLVDIISDTKSGTPINDLTQKPKKKRDAKADQKTENVTLALITAEVEAVKEQAPAVVMKPTVTVVNGKVIVQQPMTLTTSKAVESIKNQMGPSIVRNKDKKMSSLDYKARDSTDRWTKEDTLKFYKALQLMGTDFGLIESLFKGSRTRNQIKVSS